MFPLTEILQQLQPTHLQLQAGLTLFEFIMLVRVWMLRVWQMLHSDTLPIRSSEAAVRLPFYFAHWQCPLILK